MEGWRELLAQLEQLSDERRAEGKRHSIGVVLLLSIIAVISGNSSYRAIGHFLKANAEELLLQLEPDRQRLPSFSTVRRVLMKVNVEQLSAIVCNWSSTATDATERYPWVSTDAKAMKGTVENYANANQDFISMVSLFFSASGVVIGAKSFHNKKESEINVVRQLIQGCDLKPVILTADALHAKKNNTDHPQLRAPLPDKGQSRPAYAL